MLAVGLRCFVPTHMRRYEVFLLYAQFCSDFTPHDDNVTPYIILNFVDALAFPPTEGGLWDPYSKLEGFPPPFLVLLCQSSQNGHWPRFLL